VTISAEELSTLTPDEQEAVLAAQQPETVAEETTSEEVAPVDSAESDDGAAEPGDGEQVADDAAEEVIQPAGFVPQFDAVAKGLLTPTDYGGYAKDAYAGMQSNLGGYASGAMLDPATNPYFGDLMTQLGDRAVNSADARFAAAGRDFSGAHGQAIGRGVTEAQLPILAQMYGQNQDRMFQANSMLQGAGYGLSGLLSQLDTEEGNRQLAGMQAGNMAMDARTWGPQQTLAAEAARRQIPLQSQTAYSGLLGDLASRFGTQNSSQTAEKQSTPSVMDMIGQVVGIGATLMGMPGMSTTSGGGGAAPGMTPQGMQFMPSYQGSYGYSPYSNPAVELRFEDRMAAVAVGVIKNNAGNGGLLSGRQQFF
jgi:hypothetical protein